MISLLVIYTNVMISERVMKMESKKELTIEQQEALLSALKERFEKNMHRHEGLDWEKIEQKLKAKPEKLCSLNVMERTEGEPDVVGYNEQADQYIFCDCSKESPKGRRSVCYDRAALEARKKHKPKNSAMDMANEMGIEMLTEQQYRDLQTLENFDTKTSSWIKTPDDIRERGGALFCDYRYGHVFVYHNGADLLRLKRFSRFVESLVLVTYIVKFGLL